MQINSLKLLNGWSGVTLPNNTNISIWDMLSNNYPDDWYIVDHLPFVVNNFNHFSQIESLYSKNPKSLIESDFFSLLCFRFFRLMNLLWCNCEVWFETTPDIEKICTASQAKLFTSDSKDYKLIKIDNIEKYDLLISFGLEERLCPVFFFDELELILWINGLCITVFTKNPQTKVIIEMIARHEGLYMRQQN